MIPLMLLAGLALAAQFVQPPLISQPAPAKPPIGRPAWDNPKLDPRIAAILKRSCADCHSNETAWPWYSRISPVSWWLADHVRKARTQLNLSEQSELTDSDIDSIADVVGDRSMPLPSYLWIHRGAKLSDDERKLFNDWANGKLK